MKSRIIVGQWYRAYRLILTWVTAEGLGLPDWLAKSSIPLNLAMTKLSCLAAPVSPSHDPTVQPTAL